MKTEATFYHAGCPVCTSAEHFFANALDPNRYNVRIVHLGQDKTHLRRAKEQGVKSVPALVINNQVFHINHGADLAALE